MKKYEVTTVKDYRELGIRQQNIEIYVEYLQSCSVKNMDTVGTTYKTYLDNMKLFFRYLKEYENNRYILSSETLKNFTEIWERYCAYCFNRGNNKRTIANKRTAVSTFYDWCVKRKKIKVNPFLYIEKIKVTEDDKRRESYFLNAKDIWKINYVMENNSQKYDIQSRILFNLFIDSGARISEVWNIKLEQINLDEMVVERVRHKEGYIEDVIFFEGTRDLIKLWLKERENKNIENEYLFITYYNAKYNHMKRETIRDRIRKIGEIVGIKNFYPHSLRKTILNITGQQNEQLATALAHHKNSAVTREHYMKKVKLKEVRSSLRKIRELSGL